MEASPSFQDKIVLITGATNGIGKAAAFQIAEHKPHLMIVGRNREKCETVVQELRDTTPASRVDYFLCDLSSQEEIRQLSEKIHVDLPRIDVLVNNAGALFLSRRETVDGIEMTFGLNHLNYFMLTNLVIDLLEKSESARIVNVASGAHRSAKTIHFDNVGFAEDYGGMKAYSQSKLANILFTYELARRLDSNQITANCLHPGFVASGFGKNNGILAKLIMPLLHLFARNEEKGAETVTYLATSPAVEGITGKYYFDRHPRKSTEVSYNKSLAQKLWQISQEMTGLDTTI